VLGHRHQAIGRHRCPTARFANLKTGDEFATQTINTSSSAWQGVFLAMTH